MAPQNILALTLLLAIAAWFVYRIRATPTVQPIARIEPEPIPEAERCMVENPERCPERFALERHGWRLCKAHARSMLGGAA